MTDKDKIKAEIERLLTELTSAGEENVSIFEEGRISAFEDIKLFINSLPEEHVSEDLEEAAIMHYKDVMEYEAKTGLKPAYMTSFKAGAQWQKEKMINKACDWLWEYTFDDNLIKGFRKNMED